MRTESIPVTGHHLPNTSNDDHVTTDKPVGGYGACCKNNTLSDGTKDECVHERLWKLNHD